ncbi:MAG: isocitrate/isopropylmalate dehydrogenase family protein [Ignavibacteria bacterium]
MAKYKIAWLPGDGIGIEVLEAAKIVLDKLNLDAEYIHGDIGWDFWCKEGDALPQRTIDLLNNVRTAMFGAITSKPVKAAEKELIPELQGKGLVYRSPIVRMRQMFDLYNCLRPCKAYPGNPLNYKEGIDLVVFRENTEDLYSGVEFNPVPVELSDLLLKISKPYAAFKDVPNDQFAISCKINTKKGSEKIIRAAFEFAKKHNRKKVTIVHKANVVRATDGLFLETAKEIAKEYPEVKVDNMLIDACSMRLIQNPSYFDVIVTENMFGDILTDEASMLAGSMGMLPSASLAGIPSGRAFGLYEPIHGSAPDIAGMNIANPIATILCIAMMLKYSFGLPSEAMAVERAVLQTLDEGYRTKDIMTDGMKQVGTTDMGKIISERIKG